MLANLAQISTEILLVLLELRFLGIALAKNLAVHDKVLREHSVEGRLAVSIKL